MWLPFAVVTAFAAWRFWLAAFVLKADRLDSAIDRFVGGDQRCCRTLLGAHPARSAAMKIIGRMLTRMILIRFIFILLGISIFVITLDAVTYAKEILQLRGNDPGAIAYYAFLRSPGILSTFLPISVLLALLLALTELSYRNETPGDLVGGRFAFAHDGHAAALRLFVGGLYFLLNDQAVPAMAPTLREWGIGDYGEKKLKIGERDPIWMRAGPDILRAASANAQATQLEDVIIFRRDANGLLREQVFAKSAALTDGRWQLSDVIIYYRENLKPAKLDSLVYSGSMSPPRPARVRAIRKKCRSAISAISSKIPVSASAPPGSIRLGGTSG